MVMEFDVNFNAYMWIIGILMVLFAVIGFFAVGASFREDNRRRQEAKANAESLDTWDDESPNSFGHR